MARAASRVEKSALSPLISRCVKGGTILSLTFSSRSAKSARVRRSDRPTVRAFLPRAPSPASVIMPNRRLVKDPERYKTVLCAGWSSTGACSYGRKCQFAHGRFLRKHVTSYRTRIALPSHCASLIERHPPTQVQTQSSAVRSCTVHVIHRYSLLSAWIYSTCISLYRLSQKLLLSPLSSSSCFKIAASSASAAKPSTRL